MSRLPLFGPDPTYAVLQGNPGKHSKRLWTPPGPSGPAPPSYFLLDNFVAANASNLTAHTSDSGHTWAVQSGTPNTALIQANRVYGGSGATGLFYASAVPPSADYTISMEIYMASFSGAAGAVARASGSATDTCYTAVVWNFSSSCILEIDSRVNGTVTNLGNVGITTPAVASTHILDFVLSGTSLSLYWDSVLKVGPITNSAISAAGKAGLTLFWPESSTTGFHAESLTAT